MMKQKIPMCFSEINLSGHKTRLYNTIILQIIKINLKTHHSTGYSLLVPLTLLLKNNFIEYRFFFHKVSSPCHLFFSVPPYFSSHLDPHPSVSP